MICLRTTEGGALVAQSEKWGQGEAVFPLPFLPGWKGSDSSLTALITALHTGHTLASVSAPETCARQGKLPSCQGYTTGLLLDESALNSRLNVYLSLGAIGDPLSHYENLML